MTTFMGRLHAPDDRDFQHLMAGRLSITTEEDQESVNRGWRYWWQDGWWGDQWYTPHCVAYAWLHWIEDGPTTHLPYAPSREAVQMAQGSAVLHPTNVYNRAQQIDEWEGTDYDGTSVRAGAKILRDEGLITEFLWADDMEQVIDAILTSGPVVVGTNWYSRMFEPDEDNVIHIGGDSAGGHAYVLNGVNVHKEVFRIKNSWGRGWGREGTAYISFQDFEQLLSEYGEACLAIESPTLNTR